MGNVEIKMPASSRSPDIPRKTHYRKSQSTLHSLASLREKKIKSGVRKLTRFYIKKSKQKSIMKFKENIIEYHKNIEVLKIQKIIRGFIVRKRMQKEIKLAKNCKKIYSVFEKLWEIRRKLQKYDILLKFIENYNEIQKNLLIQQQKIKENLENFSKNDKILSEKNTLENETQKVEKNSENSPDQNFTHEVNNYESKFKNAKSVLIKQNETNCATSFVSSNSSTNYKRFSHRQPSIHCQNFKFHSRYTTRMTIISNFSSVVENTQNEEEILNIRKYAAAVAIQRSYRRWKFCGFLRDQNEEKKYQDTSFVQLNPETQESKSNCIIF